MKDVLKSVIKQRRMKYILFITILSIFIFLLNMTFAAFLLRDERQLANITVGKMNYLMTINTTETTKVVATANGVTIIELSITSLNKYPSKYELIYRVCNESECSNVIPSNFKIEYLSDTVSPIKGSLDASAAAVIRLAIVNNTPNNINVKFDVNSGFANNDLALKNLITNEYREEADALIAAYIDGKPSSSFPTTLDYTATVSCKVNNSNTPAVGIAEWNGSKWILNITGIVTGNTLCNVNFEKIKIVTPTAPTGITFSNALCDKRRKGYGKGSTCTGGTVVGYQYSANGSSWSETFGVGVSIVLYDYASDKTMTPLSVSGTIYVRAVSNTGHFSPSYKYTGTMGAQGCA